MLFFSELFCLLLKALNNFTQFKFIGSVSLEIDKIQHAGSDLHAKNDVTRAQLSTLIIHMKKLLDSDWLRAVQFKCNTNAKSVTPVQNV